MSYNTPYTEDAVDATITVSAEGATVANQRDISIQFLDAAGANMDTLVRCELHVLLNSTGSDFAATGGSTGIAAGATGKILASVAKKIFRGISNTSGLLQVIYTDTGTEACYLGVLLPNGKMVISSALTNA